MNPGRRTFAGQGRATVLLGAWLFAALLAAGVARAQDAGGAAPRTDCDPPAYVQRAIRGADRVDLVQLGPAADRVLDDFAPDPARFVGFRRGASKRLPPEGVDDVTAMLSSRGLACTAAGSSKGAGGIAGLQLSGPAGDVRVVVQMPIGKVEFEIPNGQRFGAGLSKAGLRAWSRLMEDLALREHRAPDDIEREIGFEPPPPAPPAPAHPAAADSAAKAHAKH